MTDVRFYIRHTPTLDSWLRDLWMRGCLHASTLVGQMAVADNVARAERALNALEREGWIQRGKMEPTREQRFFGIGGTLGCHVGGSILLHAVMPVRESEEFRVFALRVDNDSAGNHTLDTVK